MNNLETTIKLDPVNDGFKQAPDFGNVKDREGIIIGTNGKHRVIGDDEVSKIFDQLAMHSEGIPIGNCYIGMVDSRKILKVGASRFFVGSMLVMKIAGHAGIGAGLLDEDIQKILTEVESRMVTLSTGTEEFSAYQIEY